MNVSKELKNSDGIFKLNLKNFNGKEFSYKIDREHDDQWPVTFDTATTPMNDFIGNITEIYGDRCSVRGFFLGKMREIKNVRIIDPDIKNKGERIMISDHIDVNGKYELVATKKRLIDGKFANVNFSNIGWSDSDRCRYLRIDVHTGEFIEINENKPNYCNFV